MNISPRWRGGSICDCRLTKRLGRAQCLYDLQKNIAVFRYFLRLIWMYHHGCIHKKTIYIFISVV